MQFDRRKALRTLTALSSAAAFTAQSKVAAAAMDTPNSPHSQSNPRGSVLFQVVMLVYPDMTALDLVGPQLIFATMPNTQVHLVWKDVQPIRTDSGLEILPSTRMADAPLTVDLLFVPGGLKGTTALMEDAQVLKFLRDCGEKARWVTSICTGALLLGAAGLLKGYSATAHWYIRDLLTIFDCTPVDARVVTDRNRITGAGVTAGIDMALTISSVLHGSELAQRQTLAFEYQPQPPFSSGSPKLAGKAITDQVLQRRRVAIEAAQKAALRARTRTSY